MKGGRNQFDASQDNPGRPKRADQNRTLFRSPVSRDVGLLRVDESPRIRILDANSSARGREHAMKIYDYIQERNGRVVLQAIDQPITEFVSPLEVFEKALEQEQAVTADINDLYALAVREEDYASQIFLQWFVTEQVEEEKNVGDVVETLKMSGEKNEALLLFDRELGKRENEE